MYKKSFYCQYIVLTVLYQIGLVIICTSIYLLYNMYFNPSSTSLSQVSGEEVTLIPPIIIFCFQIGIAIWSCYYFGSTYVAIVEKVLKTNLTKEELTAIFLVNFDAFKVSTSSDALIALTFRYDYYNHHLAIFNTQEGIKIITNEFIFKILEPLLKSKNVDLE